MTPVFLLSTPRSGSTLLSRIFSVHPELAVSGETWGLYPMLSVLHADPQAHYVDAFARNGIRHLVENLPEGRDGYLRSVRAYSDALYPQLFEGLRREKPAARWLLDKNPRYHLFFDDLVRLFPEARFIFLTRNPLAVAASYMSTWTAGWWTLPYLEPMLMEDYACFCRALETSEGLKRRVVAFEDLVTNPVPVMSDLTEFLGLSSPLLHDQLQNMRGPGDGKLRKSAKINPERAGAWAGSFHSTIRRKWALRLIRKLPETYARFGYDRATLRRQLGKAGPPRVDLVDYLVNGLVRRIRRYAGPDLLLDLIWRARQRHKIRSRRNRHVPRPTLLD